MGELGDEGLHGDHEQQSSGSLHTQGKRDEEKPRTQPEEVRRAATIKSHF
jgi:hypothetical protein